jgi:hypothetical protein
MHDLTLSIDRATPVLLLLMHQSLYKWKTYYVMCVLQNVMKGGLHRGPRLVPPP